MTRSALDDLKLEERKQSRLLKLGTNTPRCAMCGVEDWRTIEEHHPDTRKRDQLVVLLCANCHRGVTVDQNLHPAGATSSDEPLARMGNFLLGLADMLKIIVERLNEYGNNLISQANGTSEVEGPK